MSGLAAFGGNNNDYETLINSSTESTGHEKRAKNSNTMIKKIRKFAVSTNECKLILS